MAATINDVVGSAFMTQYGYYISRVRLQGPSAPLLPSEPTGDDNGVDLKWYLVKLVRDGTGRILPGQQDMPLRGQLFHSPEDMAFTQQLRMPRITSEFIRGSARMTEYGYCVELVRVQALPPALAAVAADALPARALSSTGGNGSSAPPVNGGGVPPVNGGGVPPVNGGQAGSAGGGGVPPVNGGQAGSAGGGGVPSASDGSLGGVATSSTSLGGAKPSPPKRRNVPVAQYNSADGTLIDTHSTIAAAATSISDGIATGYKPQHYTGIQVTRYYHSSLYTSPWKSLTTPLD